MDPEMERKNMETKICEICGKKFETARPSKATCSDECKNKRLSITCKTRYYDNLEYRREYSRLANKRSTYRLKNEFFVEYGNKCAICGETHRAFLTIGHINGDGRSHRVLVGDSSRSVLADLKKKGWPKDVVQIECFNCQSRKKLEAQSTRNGASKLSILRRRAIEFLGSKCWLCGCKDVSVLEITLNKGEKYDQYEKDRVEAITKLAEGEYTDRHILLCANCNNSTRYQRD